MLGPGKAPEKGSAGSGQPLPNLLQEACCSPQDLLHCQQCSAVLTGRMLMQIGVDKKRAACQAAASIGVPELLSQPELSSAPVSIWAQIPTAPHPAIAKGLA